MKSSGLKISFVSETFVPEVNGVSLTLEKMIAGLEDCGHRISVFRPAQPVDQASFMKLTADSLTGLFPGRTKYNKHHLSVSLRMPFYPDVQVGLASVHFFRSRFLRDRPDIVHIVTEGPLGFSAMLAARSLGIGVVSDYRTHFDQYFNYYGMQKLSKAVRTYLRIFHNLTERTFVPSVGLMKELGNRGYKRVRKIGRGIDCELFRPGNFEEESAKDKRCPVIMYAGRVAPEKNTGLAIRAFRSIQQFMSGAAMIVAGDGPQKEQLERENPDINFTGFQNRQQLSELYRKSDIFLFPSLTDTYGNVVAEAAASQMAVVAYNRGAANELLTDGISGFLADGDSDDEFLRITINAVQCFVQSPSVFRGIRRSARMMAEHNSWDEITALLEKNYTDIVQGKLAMREKIRRRLAAKPVFGS